LNFEDLYAFRINQYSVVFS